MRQRAVPHSPRLTCHCRRRRLTRGHATPVERAESTRRLGSLHPLGVEPRHSRPPVGTHVALLMSSKTTVGQRRSRAALLAVEVALIRPFSHMLPDT